MNVCLVLLWFGATLVHHRYLALLPQESTTPVWIAGLAGELEGSREGEGSQVVHPPVDRSGVLEAALKELEGTSLYAATRAKVSTA